MSHLQDEHGRAWSRGERITENRRRMTPPPPRPKDVFTLERRRTKTVLEALIVAAGTHRARGDLTKAREVDQAINDIRRQTR